MLITDSTAVPSKLRRQSAQPAWLVPSVSRAFLILDLLARSALGLTKTEISKALHIPYSSTFNLLATMAHHGYVHADEAAGRYHLGLTLLGFGGTQQRDLDLRSTASPFMEELVHETQCTSHLAILDRGEAIYVHKKEPNRYFKIDTWIGKRNYPHTSAVGKALIAYIPREELRELWQAGLPKRTAKSVTSLRRLEEVLNEVRQRGYAVDDEEDEVGGTCVAAPIFNANNSVIAAVGLAGHISYFPVSKFPIFGKAVVRTAARISEQLGCPALTSHYPMSVKAVGLNRSVSSGEGGSRHSPNSRA